MKALKTFNIIAIIVPFLLASLGIFDQMFLFYAMISIMFTGLVQTVLAFVFWAKHKANIHIKIYLALSAVFFLYFFAFNNFDLDNVFSIEFWILPFCLCLYITWMIHFSENVSGKQENQS